MRKRPRVNMHVGRGHPHKPRKPKTEKEILSRIADLEYQRIILPKYPNVRIMLRWESLTNEIKRLYLMLENLRKEKEKKWTSKK